MVALDGGEWTNGAARAEQGAWIADAVAAELAAITQDGAEFVAARGDNLTVDLELDHAAVETIVSQLGARAEVDALAQNAVPNVGKMRGLALRQQQRVFSLRGVSDQAARARQGVAADIGSMAHHAATSNDTRPFNIGAWLDDGLFFNQNVLANQERARAHASAHLLPARRVGQDVLLQPIQRLPHVVQSREEVRVLK